MKIELKKFGTTLTSRQSGKEAYLAFLPILDALGNKEKIEIDFKEIKTFSPSWGDEFLTMLAKKYKERVILTNTDNLSVKITIKLLEEITGYKFKIK